MKLQRGLIAALVISIVMSIALVGCGNTDSSKSGNITNIPQEITVNLGDEPFQLDPQLGGDLISSRVVCEIFEGLYRRNQSGQPIPGAAESCDISSDGITYTFHIRDSNWSDGSKVKAEDFKTAWLRALDPSPADHQPSQMAYLLYYIKGAELYNSGKGKAYDVGLVVKDDKTLEVTLDKPTAFFLDLVCNSVYMPLNSAFYNKQPMGNKTSKYGLEATTILGNGPFIITGWKHDESITLEKNMKYWNEKEINLTKANMKIIKDNSAAFTAFRAGELDLTEITDDSQKQECLSNGYPVKSYDTGVVYYVGFNNKDAFLKNVNIRKAMSYALNRESLIKNIIMDDSEKALAFVSGTTKINRSGDLFNDNDIEVAKSLFAQGLSELKLTKAPKLTLLIEDKETASRDAQAYQEMWRQNLGLEVDIESMPFDSMIGKIAQGKGQMAYLPWSSDYNDPVAFLEVFESDNPYNVYQYSNAEYDEILGKVNSETDSSRRMDLLVQAEKKVIDEMVVCPTYFGRNSYALNKKVTGLVRTNNVMQDIDLYWVKIV